MGQILVPPVTQLLGSKWFNCFDSFWPKKLGRILIPPVTQLLRSKWLFFSLGALREKLSHVDLKNWVAWVELRQKHLG